MKVAILTLEQKNLLDKKELSDGMKFNPVKDKNEEWFITEQEIIQCTNTKFEWVKDLELVDYKLNK
jgi:hypothetical protein